ncbi:MAG: acyl carrier protein [Deltaproteobacteria bacterium]|nr:acyl carrier protein [Deltaproteobacteria bacterium]
MSSSNAATSAPEQNLEQLELELKQFIIETLALEELTSSDIESEGTLFGDGLGLDSVDALELAVALQKKYGVVIDPKDENVANHMRSVRSLAALVASRPQS